MEKKRYDEAVKKGLVDTNNSTTKTNDSAPIVEDGDVTCTGGTSSSSTAAAAGGGVQETLQQSETEMEYFDPGPTPTNPYNRGFIENWKEVLFPLSLRKNAIELGGYSWDDSGAQKPKPVSSKKTKST